MLIRLEEMRSDWAGPSAAIHWDKLPKLVELCPSAFPSPDAAAATIAPPVSILLSLRIVLYLMKLK
jgi:hypothetical protein